MGDSFRELTGACEDWTRDTEEAEEADEELIALVMTESFRKSVAD